MLCFTYDQGKLTRGIDHEDFYSPLFTGKIKDASIRVVTGGSWDLQTLTEAIRENKEHAFLCCLVELIPPTGNKSSLFPDTTCLLSIPTAYIGPSPADKSVLFASEGTKRLYGCKPDETFLRVGTKQIIHDGKKLVVEDAPDIATQITDPYHQYRGQDIAVLELL